MLWFIVQSVFTKWIFIAGRHQSLSTSSFPIRLDYITLRISPSDTLFSARSVEEKTHLNTKYIWGIWKSCGAERPLSSISADAQVDRCAYKVRLQIYIVFSGFWIENNTSIIHMDLSCMEGVISKLYVSRSLLHGMIIFIKSVK